jgi:nuclear pore complex protein Nup155
VNHSSLSSSIVAAFVPGFVLKAASTVFVSNPVLDGGPISHLKLDSDRKTLYALTSKGFIHAYDLGSDYEEVKVGQSVHNNPPKLACSVNVTKSVRRYLESVSHGKMYPPSVMGTDGTMASIRFPNGGLGAQFGVGGMNGARAILKLADAEVLRKKTHGAQTNAAKAFRTESGAIPGAEGSLHPISIHVVPVSESRHLTLVAISSGGLRYYFSVLPDAATSYSNYSLRPGRRFTLCHVRAAPPFTLNADNLTGVDKTSSVQGKGNEMNGIVVRGCYASGITTLAIDCGNKSKDEEIGDSVLVVSPDYTEKEDSSSSMPGQSGPTVPKGVNELVSLPLGTSLLPGGHVCELYSRSLPIKECNSVLSLFFRSTTPPMTSENEKLVPIFIPPSKQRLSSETLSTKINSLTYSDKNHKMISKSNLQKNTTITDVLRTVFTGKRKVITLPPGMAPIRRNTYQLSSRYGCGDSGFSLPRKYTDSFGSRMSTKAARVPPSITNPSPVPLSDMALQHLSIDTRCKEILALNSGGVHLFMEISPTSKLCSFFSDSKVSNIGKDERVKAFFKKYGHRESCAMCLSIAIKSRSNSSIVKKAVQAALSFAHRPFIVRPTQPSGEMSISSNVSITHLLSQKMRSIEGYSFSHSYLHDGLLLLISRLLRPIWCKPAVIVTEGKFMNRKSDLPEQLPAKVELLLNNETLDDLRRPLASLQNLMQEVFEPAVNQIPGVHSNDSLISEVSDNELPVGSLLTQALAYQNQTRYQNDSSNLQPSDNELVATARLIEERSIHSMYRLVSRTVQLLSLLDRISRAHFSPHLPEVEFGYIHGMS